MSIEKLSFARRRVLGDLHDRCDSIDLVPVFLEDDPKTEIGFADQSMGRYADAFSFHLPAEICKLLSAGRFSFSFGYAHAARTEKVTRPRFKLTYICLNRVRPLA